MYAMKSSAGHSRHLETLDDRLSDVVQSLRWRASPVHPPMTSPARLFPERALRTTTCGADIEVRVSLV